jgi:RNA polymerase sigma-70 factor (ECF subfamily)
MDTMHALQNRPIDVGTRSFQPFLAVRAVTQGMAPSTERAALSAHILAIAQHGDRAAFGALFAHFAPRVKGYLMRLGASPAAAEDIAQETLLSVWRKAAYFDPRKAEASTWVFAIARNLRIDVLRRERHPEPEATEELIAMVATDADAETTLDAAERGAKLRRALVHLPVEQAEIVRLAFFQDKPHSEIERELGIPLGTVKSRLRLAMSRLRAALHDLELE